MTTNIRRINVFGGPGTGKSTVASRIFGHLKVNNYLPEVELVQEIVKEWAHQGHHPEGYDQLYLFGAQMRREDKLLRNNNDLVVVTDAPVEMVLFYTLYYGEEYGENLFPILRDYQETYPALNIWLERVHDYDSSGRYQNEEEALEIDDKLESFIEEHIDFRATCEDIDRIGDMIDAYI